ncbi:peroxisomal membrane 22 kDa (Mpv17/PMP22) family protein [Wolffia australiana]
MAALVQGCFIPPSSCPRSSHKLAKIRLPIRGSLARKDEASSRRRGIGSSTILAPSTILSGNLFGSKRNLRFSVPGSKVVCSAAIGTTGRSVFATVSAGAGGSGGALLVFTSWYLNSLNKYPVPMKSVTSAFLTLVGDLICQLVIDRVPVWDVRRTLVSTFLGLALVGPTLHFWYLFLSKLVTVQGPSGAVLRLLLDQFVFSPIFIAAFLSSLVTLEGRPSQVLPKLKQEWFSSMVANWKLWIPFQFLNFWFVPQQFQVLGANVVALAWNVILSFIAHKEVKPSSITE